MYILSLLKTMLKTAYCRDNNNTITLQIQFSKTEKIPPVRKEKVVFKNNTLRSSHKQKD